MPSQRSSRHTSFTIDSAGDFIKSASASTKAAETSASSVSGHTAVIAPPTSSSRPPLSVLLAYTALCISIFLVALDTVLIPTALPTISESFHIPDSLYAWTGSAYLLANASSIPCWGTLADVFGRKPVLLVANSVFLIGSIICAVSIDAPMLVAGRAVQGLGGGGVNCLVYVCVSDLFTIRNRSFYLGIVGAVWAVASALGPVLGGVFAENLSWRWCFYINLPIVSFAIVLLYFTLHVHNPRTPFLAGMYSIDWLGTFTILAATILLLVGLQTGSTTSYSSPMVISFLVLGSLAYIIFPFTQWWEDVHGGSPIMPLRIFSDRSNLSALGVCAFDALVFNSVAYFVPLYFQIVADRSPSSTGVLMLALAIPLTVVSLTSGFVIEKTGRFMDWLQGGLVLTTAGVGALVSLPPSFDAAKAIGFLILIGAGFGPTFHTPLIALQTRISAKDTAVGTATFGFVRMLSGAIGVVLGQVIFQALMRSSLDTIVDAGVPRSFAEQLSRGEAVSQARAVAALEETQRSAVRSAFMSALRGAFICYAVVAALGLLTTFGIKRVTLKREEAQSEQPEQPEQPPREGDVESGRPNGAEK
ncbi:major facilitator superfamily domain-containing protein [Boeremia exigua]|uniref:major facilitator superfamily domain-containing protein n=1 Tax=Boeremia exigua TaxID=749465 RepID=UPI001E8DE81F|nr:major facilitator superfamily domain-containing protein [Boeremia exigua]KAH6621841.1 major facilitator superfamily domain-containing protein [Boeremia exigua]